MKWIVAIFGSLPLRVVRGIGAVCGQLLWWSRVRGIRTMKTNIRLCLPELTEKEADAMARSCCRHLMTIFFETFWLWMHSAEEIGRRTKVMEGAELLEEIKARARRKQGTVLFSMHGANPDFFSRWLPSEWDNTYITYNPPRSHKKTERVVCEMRGRGNNLYLASVAGGVVAMRGLYQRLRQGAVGLVWTDMEPSYGAGEIVPFFGLPVRTPVFPSRLASREGVKGLWCWAKRVPGGFEVYLRESAQGAESDLAKALTVMNSELEDIVRHLGAQYVFWGYKRFRNLPDYDMPSPYTMSIAEFNAARKQVLEERAS